jgi:hypothetical protein
MRMIENRMLRRMSGSKREEVANRRRKKFKQGRAFVICTFHQIKYYSGDHVKNVEIGWACSVHVNVKVNSLVCN